MLSPRALAFTATTLLLAAAPCVRAQVPDDVRARFIQWAGKSLVPVSDGGLDATTRDLSPIDTMIGDARIVGLGEGVHAGAEPLIFRNRLFKHLVERLGFKAIALESGIVEGRVLNDYVTHGRGDFETVLERGLSNGFDTFQQNRDLVRWLRDYNERLPRADKVQIFGLDVPGSPGNFDSTRRPDTAIRTALDYLLAVDPESAAAFRARVDVFLPVLADINDYGAVQQPGRDALTAAIADLVSSLERHERAYVARSSREDFDWALRTAIGARQTDTWFRHMPVGWKLADGLDWTRYAMQVRDRSMADNLEWLLGRLGPQARVLVFTAVGHMSASETRMLAGPLSEMVPFGTYVEDRHGTGFINILNLVANGEIRYCSATPQRVMPLKAPPASAIESAFVAVNVPRYLLDLRRAPAPVGSWLGRVHDHWNGFATQQFATSRAFDLVYFVSPITSACASPVEAAG
jgi:erythromycin esterase